MLVQEMRKLSENALTFSMDRIQLLLVRMIKMLELSASQKVTSRMNARWKRLRNARMVKSCSMIKSRMKIIQLKDWFLFTTISSGDPYVQTSLMMKRIVKRFPKSFVKNLDMIMASSLMEQSLMFSKPVTQFWLTILFQIPVLAMVKKPSSENASN